MLPFFTSRTGRSARTALLVVGIVGLAPSVFAQATPGEKPPPPPDASKWFAIPEKYADYTKSELTTTIKTGPNTFNIELK